MLILHVDEACYGGTGTVFHQAMEQLKQTLTLGAEHQDEFTFHGRHEYVRQLEKVKLTKERTSKPKSKLTDRELHDYRSIVGQLAWPARESMPQLAHSVSYLQQKTNQATIHDLMHANNVSRLAQKWALQDKQKLIFRPFLPDSKVNLTLQHSEGKKKKWSGIQPGTEVGLAAIADASFMQQFGEG